MGMIPGFSNALMPPGHEKESQGKIKRFMTIMDSMTDKELDSMDPKLLVVSLVEPRPSEQDLNPHLVCCTCQFSVVCLWCPHLHISAVNCSIS